MTIATLIWPLVILIAIAVGIVGVMREARRHYRDWLRYESDKRTFGRAKWECAWHTQIWGHRAWFGDDHEPQIWCPANPPKSHGICNHCAAELGIKRGGA